MDYQQLLGVVINHVILWQHNPSVPVEDEGNFARVMWGLSKIDYHVAAVLPLVKGQLVLEFTLQDVSQTSK